MKAFTANASGGGLLIKTATPLPKGERFPITLHLTEGSEPIKVVCEVVWARTETDDPEKRPVGMGVKFVEIRSSDRKKLISAINGTTSAES